MHDFAWPNVPAVARRGRRPARASASARREPEPEQAQRADVQQVAAGQAIAEPFRTAQDADHGHLMLEAPSSPDCREGQSQQIGGIESHPYIMRY